MVMKNVAISVKAVQKIHKWQQNLAALRTVCSKNFQFAEVGLTSEDDSMENYSTVCKFEQWTL